MLQSTLSELERRGYATTAILDVFARRYLQQYPDAAAVDDRGNTSEAIVCSTELVRGDYGRLLTAAAAALAANTSADTVAITELFYDRHCYDDRCLLSYKNKTGRSDWPRKQNGNIDIRHDSIGHWRSQQVAGIVERLARAVHGHGKRLAMDVKLSRGDIHRNSLENGQDYQLLAPLVDELVVWNYFGIGRELPETSSYVAAWFDDEFGPDNHYISLGLWKTGWFGDTGVLPADEFYRGLVASRLGGAKNIWITPAKDMSDDHWQALARWAKENNRLAQGAR